MTDGWPESADAWIASMGDGGDWSRIHVLDAPMLARVTLRPYAKALDVGCGEGRFCRMLRKRGIDAVGIDPTEAFIAVARTRDPDGEYRQAGAEKLPFPDASFDLVVSYLTLIDIPDYRAALAEMTRVLKPGGALLIANLNSFISSSSGWIRSDDGRYAHYPVDNYLEERATWVEWAGIRIHNWHRPLSAYMGALLGHGLQLQYFDEPATQSGDERQDRHNRAPWFVMMEWRKPG